MINRIVDYMPKAEDLEASNRRLVRANMKLRLQNRVLKRRRNFLHFCDCAACAFGGLCIGVLLVQAYYAWPF